MDQKTSFTDLPSINFDDSILGQVPIMTKPKSSQEAKQSEKPKVSVNKPPSKAPKTKSIPKEYVTPFEQVYNAFLKSKLYRNYRLMYRKLRTMQIWQQGIYILYIIY